MIRELYRFTWGASVYTVTSADAAETYNSETYSRIAIGRTAIESRPDTDRASVTVSMGLDNSTARNWLVNARDSAVVLTLYEKDTDAATVGQIWKGRLMSVKPTTSTIELVFETHITAVRRQGLRRQVQTSCPYMIYHGGCRLNHEDFDVAGTVSAITGVAVTVSSAASSPDGTYTGGMLEEPSGVMRYIAKHAGSTLTLDRPSKTLLVNDAVRIFPGCDQSLATCDSRFSNKLNFGGFPYRPPVNPFGGTSIV